MTATSRRANSCATDAPMPRLAPVTIATFPLSSSFGIASFSFSRPDGRRCRRGSLGVCHAAGRLQNNFCSGCVLPRQCGGDGGVDQFRSPRTTCRHGCGVGRGVLDRNECNVGNAEKTEQEPQVGLEEVGGCEWSAVQIAAGTVGDHDEGTPAGKQACEALAVVGKGAPDPDNLVDPRLER